MKARGIMVYDFFEQEWRIWIGQQKYYMEPGSYFELRIKDKYFPAILQKDTDWFISLKYNVSFTLHPYSVYRVRIWKADYFLVPEEI